MHIIPSSFYGKSEFKSLNLSVKSNVIISLENYIKAGNIVPIFEKGYYKNRLQIVLADGTKTRLYKIENNRVYYKKFGTGNKMLSTNIKLIKVVM